MSESDTTNNTPEWLRMSPELEHFNPFEGLVDLHKEQAKNVQYGIILCRHHFIFEQTLMCEVVQNDHVYPIPNTPNWIKGLINLRGNLVPVFNLYDYWNIKDRPKNLPLIIMGTGDDAFGIYCDSYPQAIEVDDAVTVSVPLDKSAPAELSSFTSLTYQFNNNIWHHIDMIGLIRHITRDYSDENPDSEII